MYALLAIAFFELDPQFYEILLLDEEGILGLIWTSYWFFMP